MSKTTKQYFEKLRKELKRIKKKRQYKGQHYKFNELLASLPSIKNKSLSKEKNFDYQYEDKICPNFTFKNHSIDVKNSSMNNSNFFGTTQTAQESFLRSTNVKIENWVNFEFHPKTSHKSKRMKSKLKYSKRKNRLIVSRENSVRLNSRSQGFKRNKKLKDKRFFCIPRGQSSGQTSKKTLSPINESSKPINKRIIDEPIYVEKSKAVDSVYSSLFRKGPVNIEYLKDDTIFEELENGLSNKELTWLSTKREQVIEKYMTKKEKCKNLSQSHSLNIKTGNVESSCRLTSSLTKRSGNKFMHDLTSNRSNLNSENQNSSNEYKTKADPDVLRNISTVSNNQRGKITSILERNTQTSMSKNDRIKIVKNMKDKLMNDKRMKIKSNIERREHRSRLFLPESIKIQTHQFYQNSILITFLHDIHSKFELRKQTRERVQKIGRKICWITKSLGAFKMLLKKVRYKIAANKIQYFARKFCRKWLKKREHQQAVIIYQFLKFNKDNEGKIDLKKMKFYNIMVKVEKRLKQYISRRRLRYAILNNRWNVIEAKYFRKGIYGITDQFGNYKNIVPYKVRRVYFCEYLRFLRIEYIKECRIWEKYNKDGTLKEYTEIIENNDLNSLKQKRIVKTSYKIPVKPIERTLISFQQMREIVRETTDNEHRWDQIADGEFEPPIFKKMKSVKYNLTE
ncbi:unnamed protein product [Moneuplotes crassus]|uniref:Uncharacterized protein n=1 Tax=Euplotes crassus TaxID=5936 RepID=A0AAD1Y9B8_EUPCR|nr:unnamed protein product [Moneuplotes crassus]